MVERSHVQFRAIWNNVSDGVARDAADYWTQQRLLPQGVDPTDRVSQLIAAAYEGDRLVAVATGEVANLPHLRREFVFIRVSVHPEARRHRIAYEMSEYAVRVLEEWAQGDEQNHIAGAALVIESAALREASAYPEWPIGFRAPADTAGGWHLVGYNKTGQQVRVAWFNHTRVR